MLGARCGESRQAKVVADLPAGGLAASRHLVAHLQPHTSHSSTGGVVASPPSQVATQLIVRAATPSLY